MQGRVVGHPLGLAGPFGFGGDRLALCGVQQGALAAQVPPEHRGHRRGGDDRVEVPDQFGRTRARHQQVDGEGGGQQQPRRRGGAPDAEPDGGGRLADPPSSISQPPWDTAGPPRVPRASQGRAHPVTRTSHHTQRRPNQPRARAVPYSVMLTATAAPRIPQAAGAPGEWRATEVTPTVKWLAR